MKKINIAELLKDCPSGMELDCILYDNIYFDTVGYNTIKCYIQNKEYRTSITFDIYGGLIDSIPTKCVIFPKGKTTWEGFVPPCKFKDGDIIYIKNFANKSWISIYKKIEDNLLFTFVDISLHDNKFLTDSYLSLCEINTIVEQRIATEEEKQKLFQVIEANGYKWNDETKTLEKFIEHKFKVGDRVKRKNVNYTHIVTISEIDEDYYGCVNEGGEYSNIYVKSAQDNWELVPDEIEPKFKVGDVVQDKDGYKVEITEVNISDECYEYISKIAKGIGSISFEDQDKWELVPEKFNISTLVPFESKVLVRDFEDQIWRPAIFGGYIDERDQYKYMVIGGLSYKCLIPYEGNEHLRGKDTDCDEFYKTWEE